MPSSRFGNLAIPGLGKAGAFGRAGANLLVEGGRVRVVAGEAVEDLWGEVGQRERPFFGVRAFGRVRVVAGEAVTDLWGEVGQRERPFLGVRSFDVEPQESTTMPASVEATHFLFRVN